MTKILNIIWDCNCSIYRSVAFASKLRPCISSARACAYPYASTLTSLKLFTENVMYFLRLFNRFELMRSKMLTCRWTCDKSEDAHRWTYPKSDVFPASFSLPWTRGLDLFNISLGMWQTWGYTPMEVSKKLCFLCLFYLLELMRSKMLIFRWTCDKNDDTHQWNYQKC